MNLRWNFIHKITMRVYKNYVVLLKNVNKKLYCCMCVCVWVSYNFYFCSSVSFVLFKEFTIQLFTLILYYACILLRTTVSFLKSIFYSFICHVLELSAAFTFIPVLFCCNVFHLTRCVPFIIKVSCPINPVNFLLFTLHPCVRSM